MDDERLVERAKKGHMASFEVLVMRYSRMVFAVAYSVLGDAEAARDASQNAFLKAYLGLKGFRGDSRFSTWLYSIARRCAIDMARRMMKAPESIEDAPEPYGLPDRRGMILDEALRSLDEREREVINLHYKAGFSAGEIGDLLGLTEVNVRVIMFRARKKLREALRGKEDELLGGQG
ncbi:MAG: sigma-70 family RNA polymerase sigma factor [candidate division WOR-3 bacterium]